MTKPKRTFAPLTIALVLVFGMWIGKQFQFFEAGPSPIFSNNQSKIEQLIFELENNYVDKINVDSLVEESIHHILEQLDPHSTYISSKEMEQVTESMQGNFDGIGIEFQIQDDTIRVVSAIAGGPSEKLGIQSGDCIIKVDTVNLAGIGIRNKDVVENLRGKSGSKVKVFIKRSGIDEPIEYTITRAKIPLYSVDVSYMLNEDIGYIKINRFSATTYEEYIQAFTELEAAGMKKMILDLRNNPGGYLHTAIDLTDEFLEDKKLIVYTEGDKRMKEYHYATEKGLFEQQDIVVLINEGSASASEIVAGAIQDNDRGWIVGRRSFGKGLVQEQSRLSDGSALRITTSRYYTPSGRCIQKPYSEGLENYHVESLSRYHSGELFEADSMHVADSLKFTTRAGKTVYGGGGIYPDHFIPIDTSYTSFWLNNVLSTNILDDFAFQYANKNRKYWKEEKSLKSFKDEFSITDAIYQKLLSEANDDEIEGSETDKDKAKNYIKYRLKSLIARKIWSNEGLYTIWNTEDPEVQKAVEILDKS
jgi:carboxyl-terminal processing protease